MARTAERGTTRARTTRGNGAAAPIPRDVHARQREEYGGINWGAAFFGWLVAIGVAALLTAILSAAGAAIGLTESSTSQAESNAGTVGIVGGIILLAILGLAYYAGGYVAGRMSRFDGPRQGVAIWVIGLIVTVVLAVAGVRAGRRVQRALPAQPPPHPGG